MIIEDAKEVEMELVKGEDILDYCLEEDSRVSARRRRINSSYGRRYGGCYMEQINGCRWPSNQAY